MKYLLLLLWIPSILDAQYEIGESYENLKQRYPNALILDWKAEQEANPDTDAFDVNYYASLTVPIEDDIISSSKSLHISDEVCTFIQYDYNNRADFLQKIRSIRYDENWTINEWGLYESYIKGYKVVMLFSNEYICEGCSEYQVYFKIWEKL